MSSGLLTKMGLGNFDIAYLFIGIIAILIVLIILVIVQLVKYKKLAECYEKFMQGSKAISLEKEMQELISDVDELKKTTKKHSNEIKDLYKKHETALQKVGLIKYDAFKEMGGKLSYAIAVLDQNDDGFIITSVHSSAGCYSYTKKINHGECDIELSEEEKIAIERAITGISSKEKTKKQ